jgi:hypothetical protein
MRAPKSDDGDTNSAVNKLYCTVMAVTQISILIRVRILSVNKYTYVRFAYNSTIVIITCRVSRMFSHSAKRLLQWREL